MPFVLTGTGLLPADVELTLQAAVGAGSTCTATLQPGQVLSNSLSIDLPAGRHTLTGTLRDGLGNQLDQESLELVLLAEAEPALPDVSLLSTEVQPPPVAAGEPFTVTLELANRGAAGPVLVGLQAFDALHRWVITPTAWLTQTFPFSLTVPLDVPAGDYSAQALVDGQGQAFVVSVAGRDVGLALDLDRPWYLAGDEVALAVTLAENAGVSADYSLSLRAPRVEDVITVTVAAGQVVQHTFHFTATETGRASVTLANAPLEAHGQRVITIDSLPLVVVDATPGAYLISDRQVYGAGETIYLTATVTGTVNSLTVMGPMELSLQDDGFLLWQPPRTETGMSLVQPGAYPLSYAIPSPVRSGRYTFLLQIDGRSYPYLVDVRGWSVTARRLTLDRPRYAPQDELTATVEFFNEGDQAIDQLRLTAWVVTPDDGAVLGLTPPVSRTVDLLPGLNVFTITGTLETPAVGQHRLLVNVGPGCCGWRVAGATGQFDVGWSHLVELTTDHGAYEPGQPGTGRLDAYGFGPTHLVVTATDASTLLDTWVDLWGYDTFDFAIPTASVDDYLLVGTSTDQAGATHRLQRAYAVVGPPDTRPPELTLTYPTTGTLITSVAPTTTITIEGTAWDDSGQVTVLVNGEVVALAPDGGARLASVAQQHFSLPMEIQQGFNTVSAVAVDASMNVTYTAVLPVYLMPARGITLTVDRPAVAVGERVTFQTVLTATGVISDVVLQLPLPSEMVTDVVTYASSGAGSVGGFDPGWQVATWQGDVSDGQPVTVTVQATMQAAGTLSQAATAYWGWGFIDDSNTVTVESGPLAVRLAGFEAIWSGDAMLITWETVSEADHLGFNLYRAEQLEGPWTRVNEALIPGRSPGSTSGQCYEWLDRTATAGVTLFYRLESVDVNGGVQDEGVIRAGSGTLGGPLRVYLPLINLRDAPGERGE